MDTYTFSEGICIGVYTYIYFFIIHHVCLFSFRFLIKVDFSRELLRKVFAKGMETLVIAQPFIMVQGEKSTDSMEGNPDLKCYSRE